MEADGIPGTCKIVRADDSAAPLHVEPSARHGAGARSAVMSLTLELTYRLVSDGLRLGVCALPFRISEPDAPGDTVKFAPRLFDDIRDRMRRLGMSMRTEDAYLGWMRRFI